MHVLAHKTGHLDNVVWFTSFGECIHEPGVNRPHVNQATRDMMAQEARLSGVELNGRPAHDRDAIISQLVHDNPGMAMSLHPRVRSTTKAAAKVGGVFPVLQPVTWKC